MKSLILTVITIFAFNAHSDIQITGIQGVKAIQGAADSVLLTVDANSSEEIAITFLSTEMIGVPRLTFISSAGISSVLPTVSSMVSTYAMNQAVTLRIPANMLCGQLLGGQRGACNTTALRIGIDANADGDLDSAEDDALTFAVAF